MGAATKKKEQLLQRTINELEGRKIKFEEKRHNEPITENLIRPKLAPLEDYPVRIDENGILVWPISFCYPEYLFSDFQQQVSEDIL